MIPSQEGERELLGAKCFADFDSLHGNRQMPLASEAQEVSTILKHDALFTSTRVPRESGMLQQTFKV